jgi:hypothetical protein
MVIVSPILISLGLSQHPLRRMTELSVKLAEPRGIVCEPILNPSTVPSSSEVRIKLPVDYLHDQVSRHHSRHDSSQDPMRGRGIKNDCGIADKEVSWAGRRSRQAPRNVRTMRQPEQTRVARIVGGAWPAGWTIAPRQPDLPVGVLRDRGGPGPTSSVRGECRSFISCQIICIDDAIACIHRMACQDSRKAKATSQPPPSAGRVEDELRRYLSLGCLYAADLTIASHCVVDATFANFGAEVAGAIQKNPVEQWAIELRSQPRTGFVVAEWHEIARRFRFHPVTGVPDETRSRYFSANTKTV